MKVILKTDVEKVGRAGDVKDVALGFARNFLFVRGLAMEATPSAMRWFEKGKEKREKARQKLLEQARETCGKLADVRLSFSRRSAEGGKLFGSVGRADIAKSLKASGYAVERSAVILDAPIKEAGDFEVEIRMAPEASAKVKVSVVTRS